jgi:OFA family oxalate/formate antiporter-like MFS transporter
MNAVVRPEGRAVAYQGWTMAFVAFMSFALTIGPAGSTMPLIYGAVVAEFGWSLTEATLVYTYKNAGSAIATLLLVGPLVARLGLRSVMVAAFVLTALGMMAYLAVDSRAMFYTAGAIQGVGLAMAVVAANLLVSRWFYHNQGVAIGLALAGVSVGGTVFPLLAAPLMEAFGWRAAMAGLSLFIWLFALPLYLWKARENPTAAELALEGGEVPARSGADARAAGKTVGSSADSGSDAVAPTPAFWRIAAALLLIAVADMAVIQHMPLLLAAEAGFDAETAAMGLSVLFAFAVIGKIAAGRLYDRLSLQGMRLWYLLVALSIALILPVVGLLTLVLFAAVRGIAHGGLLPKPAVLAKHCYGPRQMEAKLPLFLGIWMIGAGLGPVLLAMIVDATGEYRWGLALLVGCCVLAAVLLRAPRPVQRDSVDQLLS